MLHGNNLIVSLDGMPLASSTGCELQMERDFMEVCGPTDGAWLQYLPTTLGWTVSSDGLLADMAAVRALHERMVSGQAVALRFYDSTFAVLYKGAAFVKSLRFSGQVGSMAKYSISLQGSGALTTDTEGYTLEVDHHNPPYDMSGYQMVLFNHTCKYTYDALNDYDVYLRLYPVRLPRCRVVGHSVSRTVLQKMLQSHVALFRLPPAMLHAFILNNHDPDNPVYRYLPYCHSADENYDEGVEHITDVILPAGEYTVAVERSNLEPDNNPWLQVFS